MSHIHKTNEAGLVSEVEELLGGLESLYGDVYACQVMMVFNMRNMATGMLRAIEDEHTAAELARMYEAIHKDNCNKVAFCLEPLANMASLKALSSRVENDVAMLVSKCREYKDMKG